MAAELVGPVEFVHVDVNPRRQVVRAVVTGPDGARHTVGHLVGEGWFCTCPAGKRCELVAVVRRHVPGIPVGGT